jgi:hypothetical protein
VVSANSPRRPSAISSQQVVFFTRGDNLANLNNAVLYVTRNEPTNRLKVVIVVADPSEVPKRLTRVPMIDFSNGLAPEPGEGKPVSRWCKGST